MTKKTYSIQMEPATMHRLRVLAVHHDVPQGVMLDTALKYFHAIAPLHRASIMACVDTVEGEIVPNSLSEDFAVATAKRQHDILMQKQSVENAEE